MSSSCPKCGAAVEPDDRFCMNCGLRRAEFIPLFTERIEIRSTTNLPAGSIPEPVPLPPLAPPVAPPPAAGSELVIEVGSNAEHVLNHASLLQFRVTNNIEAPCGVTIVMRLHGQGRFIEQEAEELQQCCQFDHRGDQCIFSFSFVALKPGKIAVQELRVVMTRPDRPGRESLFKLSDQSLFVQIRDPAFSAATPGIVVSGGINLDFSQLKEMYGADIKNLLNLNAPREADSGQTATIWQPILLRQLGDVALEPEETLPPELRLTLPGGVALELVRIEAGEFSMGSPPGQGRDDERPLRRVRITRDFYLGKFPITQEQYQALLGENPSKFSVSPLHPVENVSWDQSREFCRRLWQHLIQSPASTRDQSIQIDTVSLPTEAQWEYACRAGTEMLYTFGDDRALLAAYGWLDKNSQRATHPVGQLRPNGWGLHDLYGNVWEWCEDFFASQYDEAERVDPRGPSSGQRRVLRGGSWNCYAKDCRSASRHTAAPNERTANYGFRVAVAVNR